MPNPGGAKQKIDLETWERRALFEFFHPFSEPYHGVCIRVDCTATYDYAKQHGLSVFLSLLHRSLVAARQVENFRTRIVDGIVWRHDEIDGAAPLDARMAQSDSPTIVIENELRTL
jgi:chloramphenicol O-acetyltransferase type A